MSIAAQIIWWIWWEISDFFIWYLAESASI